MLEIRKAPLYNGSNLRHVVLKDKLLNQVDFVANCSHRIMGRAVGRLTIPERLTDCRLIGV